MYGGRDYYDDRSDDDEQTGGGGGGGYNPPTPSQPFALGSEYQPPLGDGRETPHGGVPLDASGKQQQSPK